MLTMLALPISGEIAAKHLQSTVQSTSNMPVECWLRMASHGAVLVLVAVIARLMVAMTVLSVHFVGLIVAVCVYDETPVDLQAMYLARTFSAPA